MGVLYRILFSHLWVYSGMAFLLARPHPWNDGWSGFTGFSWVIVCVFI